MLESALDELECQWEALPVAEVHQLDAICDRFELAMLQNEPISVEPFLQGKSPTHQRLLALELVPLELQHRRARGDSPTVDEYAHRFPQWQTEIRELVAKCLAEFDTIDGNADPAETVITSKEALYAQWSEAWRASGESVRKARLPADGVLGHYRLRSVIGRGGMGVVVKAHDTKLSRDVAIKVLTNKFSLDATAHQRFLAEARSAAGIRHNHVVTVYAVEEVEQTPFLVMELVEGPTLDKHLRENGKLATDEIVSLAHQLAEGLAAAHQQGVVHQDVKPANILLEKIGGDLDGLQAPREWHAKITDFGLARAGAEMQLKDSGVIAGTPQFMSPEQASGSETDARSDLFSLGCVMYAMCTENAPFQSDSPQGVLQLAIDANPRPLHELSPETPVELVEIIERLMAKSPGDRFQTAEEVAAVLGAQLRQLQAGAAIQSAKNTSNAPLRWRPGGWRFAMCAMAFIAICASVVLYLSTSGGGTIRFEVNDPGIQLTFAGKVVDIQDADKSYRFASGDHNFSVRHGELAFETNEFKLVRGEEVRLKVTYLASRLVVERDGKLLWAETTEGGPTDAALAPTGHVWPEDVPPPAIAPFTAQAAVAHQREWATHLGMTIEFENSIGMEFRVIPPGEFLMGSSEQELMQESKTAYEKSLPPWYMLYMPAEGPQHRVALSAPFGIGLHEVTRGQFRKFVEATGYKTEAEVTGVGGSGFRGKSYQAGPEFTWDCDLGFKPQATDSSPVVNVSWKDAAAFCRWLSGQEGAGYRLPTEAEWEFACRSGNSGRFSFGDDETELGQYAWIDETDRIGASEVGQKQANAFGLFDMHGNVWEYCLDWHGPYSNRSVVDPTGPKTGSTPVGRGGAWSGAAEMSRSTFRSKGAEGAYSVGFRVVRILALPLPAQTGAL